MIFLALLKLLLHAYPTATAQAAEAQAAEGGPRSTAAGLEAGGYVAMIEMMIINIIIITTCHRPLGSTHAAVASWWSQC